MDLHRRITLAAVLALHLVLAAVLLHASRTIRVANDREIVSTLILLREERRPRPATNLNGQHVPTPLQKVEPVEIEAGSITLPGDAAPQIDWMTEAREVAAEQSATLKAATPDRREAQATELSPAPEHVAGEQYRNAEGEAIVWITRGCYLLSPTPEIAAPNALAHAAMPRTVCPGGSEAARGDLFKSLPAYEKWGGLSPRR